MCSDIGQCDVTGRAIVRYIRSMDLVCNACLVNSIYGAAIASGGGQQEIDCAIEYALGKLDFCERKRKKREAIMALVGGRNTFVSLPMSYGKSLCYCLLPLVFYFLRGKFGQSIVICVSPLMALMLDQ